MITIVTSKTTLLDGNVGCKLTSKCFLYRFRSSDPFIFKILAVGYHFHVQGIYFGL